ncbi:MAG TPA: phosphotransferase, partial [Polyangiaceae bacterium]|nr:phosphotransferase [Polyangiaceae bacterium]
MATYTELPLSVARDVGATFGLEVTAATGVPAGSVNSNYRLELAGGATVFARVYEEQDRDGAEGEARLLDHLARHGVATPRPLPRKDGEGFTFSLGGQPKNALGTTRAVALFPWRSGEILCQARVTPDIARLVGEKLAEIHRAGQTFPEPRPGRFRVADMRERLIRIA